MQTAAMEQKSAETCPVVRSCTESDVKTGCSAVPFRVLQHNQITPELNKYRSCGRLMADDDLKVLS